MDSIVTFGKFKGKTLRHMLEDQKYMDWVKTNPELCAKLHSQFDLNIFDYSAPHNVLQMKFLSPTFLQHYLRATTKMPNASEWREMLHNRMNLMMQRKEWCFDQVQWTLPAITEEVDTTSDSVHFEHKLGWDLTVRHSGLITLKSEETIDSFSMVPSPAVLNFIMRQVKTFLLESNRWGWKPDQLDWFVCTEDLGEVKNLKEEHQKRQRFREFLNSFQPVETMISVLNWKHHEVKRVAEKAVKSLLQTVFQYEQDILKIKRLSVKFEKLDQLDWIILYQVEMPVTVSESSLHFVEISSTLAEDYPRFLQELKLRREQVNETGVQFVVIVDQLKAVSATRQEIVEMFENEGFRMMFFDELDDDIDTMDRRIESLSVDLQNLKKRRKLAKNHKRK